MGYRDDFYIVDFIIGYTGVLHKNPSVYFFDPAKNAFGHITQHHALANNIGREPYVEDDEYDIENTFVNSAGYPVGEYAEHEGLPVLKGKRSVEWKTDPEDPAYVSSFHRSRGPFRPIKPSKFFPEALRSETSIAICSKAIYNFTELKDRYT